MKNVIVSLLSVAAFAAVSLSAQPALAQQALPVHNVYSSAPLSSTAYVQLVASSIKGLKALSLSNTGSVAVAIAFGAMGSEVQQLVVPATSSALPVVYPVGAGYGTRISAISIGGGDSVGGALDMNVIFN